MTDQDIVIGIDLGSTNSAVAVPASAPINNVTELLEQKRLIAVEDAYVLTDSLKRPVTPSVVWIDQDGAPLVGHRAKQKAGMRSEPPPAMFFKRLMGSADKVTAGHRELTPEEASAHVLRYLKELAEEVLGVSITRAVVTVPAFFEMPAKQATTLAGRLAGLEIETTLLEPVAAALMYTRNQQEINHNLMVYDLGGGTFDVSIAVPDPVETFAVKGFDGDRFLGGYDFDRRLASFIVDQLGATYDLALQPQLRQEDAVIFQHFLVKAEKVKHALSDEIETVLTDTTQEDRAGNPMHIDLTITRDRLESLVKDDIERTLISCDQALEKAGVSPDQLHEIIMVGGSSRIPYVQERLREKYGMQPKLVNPDLCVAVGAAIQATTAAARAGCLVVDRPPGQTPLPTFDVGGKIVESRGVDQVSNVTVTLASADGAHRQQQVSDDAGNFIFQDVPLRSGAENDFSITVAYNGQTLAEYRFAVQQGGTGGGGGIPDPNVLAHDVSVRVVGGLHAMAKSGQHIPYLSSVTLQSTRDNSEKIDLELYDGNTQIGTVTVELPASVPAGSDVELTLNFLRDWRVEAYAKVPVVTAEAIAVIELPREKTPEWGEIRQRTAQALAEWSEKRALAPASEKLMKGPRIEELSEALERLLNEGQDAPHACHVLKELETLIASIRLGPGGGLQPPREEFDSSLGRAEELLSILGQMPDKVERAASHRARIETLRSVGYGAYETSNQTDWAVANRNLTEAIQAIESEIRGPQPQRLAEPELLLDEIAREVDGLRALALQSGVLDRFSGDFDAILAQLHAAAAQMNNEFLTDGQRQQMSSRLVVLYHNRVAPLRVRMQQAMGPSVEVDVQLPPSALPGSGPALRSAP